MSWRRNTSMIVSPAGISYSPPLFASRTRNGRSSPNCFGRARRRAGEIFAMNGTFGPCRGGDGRGLHHARGAAIIQMRSGLWVAQRRGDVEPARRIAAVVMEAHPPLRREQVEIVAERRRLGRARAIVQQELGPAAAQFGNHRHDRGDADAARQQQIALGLLGQRKVVARHRGFDRVADADPLVPMARAFAFAVSRNTAMQ